MLDRPAASPSDSDSPSLRTTRSGVKTQKVSTEPTSEAPKIHSISPPPEHITPDLPSEQSVEPEQPDVVDDQMDTEGLGASEGEGRVNGSGGAHSNSDSPAGDAVPLAAVPRPVPAPVLNSPGNGNSPSNVVDAEPPSPSLTPSSSPSPPSTPSHNTQTVPPLLTTPPLDAAPPAEIPETSESNLDPIPGDTSPHTDHVPVSGGLTSSSLDPDSLLGDSFKETEPSGFVNIDGDGGDQRGPITAAAEVPQDGDLSALPPAEPVAESISDSDIPSSASALKPSESDPSLSADLTTDSVLAAPPDDAAQAMDLSLDNPLESMHDPSYFQTDDMSMMPSGHDTADPSALPYDSHDDMSSMVHDLSGSSASYLPDYTDSTSSSALPNVMTDLTSDFIVDDPPAHLTPHPQLDMDTAMTFSTDDTPETTAMVPVMHPEALHSDTNSVGSQPPSGYVTTSPQRNGVQVSPSWAPTVISDNDPAVNNNSSATTVVAPSSPAGNLLGSPNESKPGMMNAAEPVQHLADTLPTPELESGLVPPTDGRATSVKVDPSDTPGLAPDGTGSQLSQGVSPNAAPTAVNSDAGDAKAGSPTSPKSVDHGGVMSGDPKAGLVLSLNENLIKICVAFSAAGPGMPPPSELEQFQARLASNLNWLASVADTVTNQIKPGTQVSIPILQPPKPVASSQQTAQCADALARIPSLYTRMQELFRADYERKVKRDGKIRMRAAAAAANGMGVPGGQQQQQPPGAAMPVAGVKRERDGDADLGDRKRMAVGAPNSMDPAMSNGGSPTRASAVRAGSLALSQTQSPVMSHQSPSVGGGMQMGSAMSTPRMSTGFALQPMIAQQRQPSFAAPSQTSPVSSMPPQQQRQPSLPPHSQHSPTHPQQMMQQQSHFAQPGPPPVMAQTTGGSGVPSPQRPPSVTQNASSFQAQPNFQAPGMINRGQQQQTMTGPVGMNGRPGQSDDQRTQHLSMQLRQQHMAGNQGSSQPSQLASQGQNQGQQPQQQAVTNTNGQMPNGMLNQGMVQQIVNHLQNPQHPLTQHLHRNVPNFASQPLQAQVNHFHAVHLRLVQNQQQQQQAQQQHGHVSAGAPGNPSMNATGPNPRPPSASGIPAGMAGLRNMRQGTASPRIPGTVPVQTMATPQRQISGQHQHQQQQHMTSSPSVPPLGMGPAGMTPQQRQMMMMMQQQAQLNTMMPPSAGSQSSGGSHSPFGPPRQGLPQQPPLTQQQQQHGMTPIARGGTGGPAPFGQTSSHGGGSQSALQQVPQTHPHQQWATATPAGYVSSPLNPGWSPQTAGGPHSMAGASPVSSGGVVSAGGGFHVGASPAPHSESGATPRHSGATPQSAVGYEMSGSAGGGEYENVGDPSALFNETW